MKKKIRDYIKQLVKENMVNKKTGDYIKPPKRLVNEDPGDEACTSYLGFKLCSRSSGINASCQNRF